MPGRKLATLRCSRITPFGCPVEPEVYSTYATFSGVTPPPAPLPARFAASSPEICSHSASRSTTVTVPGTRSPLAASVRITVIAVSAIMNASRSAGRAGSSGTYPPPAFQIPSKAASRRRLVCMQTPTSTSGPTPSERSSRAIWFACRFSSA